MSLLYHFLSTERHKAYFLPQSGRLKSERAFSLGERYFHNRGLSLSATYG